MTSRRPIDRRAFLGTAAAGAAALAMADTGVTQAAPARDAVTLEFWNPATDPFNGGNMLRLVNEFNNSIGKANGIVVRNHAVPTDNAYVKYTTAMTSTGSPDAIMTYDASMIAAWAANNFIQPMDAYAEQMKLKASDFYPVVWRTAHFDGRLWGLLQEFDMVLLGWNKAIHQGPPPTTIAELDALAKKYIKMDSKGNLMQAGLLPWQQGGYLLWGAALGCSFYDQAKAKFTINTPANRKVLDWFLKHAEMVGGRSKGDGLVAAGGQVAANRGIFYTGGSAFGVIGEYDPPHMNILAPHLKYGVAQVPTGPGVPLGTNFFPGGNLLLLPTKSAHPKEAAIFLRWMGSLQGLLKWCITAQNLAPLPSAEPGLLKAVPRLRPWVEAVKSPHVKPLITSPLFSLFDAAMGNAVDSVTFKRKTSAQALADVETKVATAVQQFQSLHPSWPGQ